MGRIRTKRSFTTFDPGQRKFYVRAGWDRKAERYWLDVWDIDGSVCTKRFHSRTDLGRNPTFADLVFVLKEFGLHFPHDWAHQMLSDRDGTCIQRITDVADFGTYHATKPPKDGEIEQIED